MNNDIPSSKGSILRSLLHFVSSELSDEQFARVLDSLPPDDVHTLKGNVLSTDRIPEATLNRLTVAAARESGEDLDSFAIRAGRAELKDSLKIYRFLLSVMTPQGLLSRASAMWSTVHDRGTLTVVEQSSQGAKMQLSGFPSERAHCSRLTGWFQGLAELSSVKHPRTEHTRCISKVGGDVCEWTLHWD